MKKFKRCNLCKLLKLVLEFYKDNTRIDRLQYCCKSCSKTKNHSNYLLNKSKILERNKLWISKNRKRANQRIIKYNKQRLLTDINFKLGSYLRNRVRLALRGNPKLETTVKLVGCSIEKLRRHLAFQFQPGMSWNNYGKWHIDHIKPCAKFDLSKISEQKKCFNYTNLQPLWAKDNLKKGDN